MSGLTSAERPGGEAREGRWGDLREKRPCSQDGQFASKCRRFFYGGAPARLAARWSIQRRWRSQHREDYCGTDKSFSLDLSLLLLLERQIVCWQWEQYKAVYSISGFVLWSTPGPEVRWPNFEFARHTENEINFRSAFHARHNSNERQLNIKCGTVNNWNVFLSSCINVVPFNQVNSAAVHNWHEMHQAKLP